MDTGSKSLAQLSEEGKEKKFISIEVGSKVSGYTKDYLERLCRLNKVEYRLRDNGAFAVELESLLNETHTILLSYEGVTFIEKSELTIPETQEEGKILSSALQDVHTVAVASMSDVASLESSEGEASPDHFAHSVPRFGDMNKLSQQVFGGNPFSFVGRTVVSDGKTSEVGAEKETHIPIGAGVGAPTLQEIPIAQIKADTNISFHAQEPSVSPTSIPPVIEKKEEDIPKVAAVHTPLHIPISVGHEEKESEPMTPKVVQHIPVTVPHKPAPSVKLEVTRDTSPEKPADDWDNLLFSGGHISSAPTSPTVVSESKEATPSAVRAPETTSTPAPAPSGFDIASPYRPIKTSMDATEHHEGGALFPEISKVPLEAPKSVVQKSEAPSSFVPAGGQKVIVFDPQSLMHADTTLGKTIPEAPKLIIPRAMPIGQDAQRVMPLSAPDTSVKEESPVAPPPASAIGNNQIIPKVPLATMRVMPQIPAISPSLLPEIEPEHRVLIREDHPLLASRGLNVAFALFIGVASLVLVGGMTAGKLGVDLNSASYVAGVGNVNQSARPSVVPVQYTPTSEVLPFSNDVIVSTSTSSSSVRVTPVFSDGEGTTYQYEMVEQSAVSADSESNPAR